MALAVRRLAGQLFGGSASFWILLTFPLTFTFMRIPDSRGTVVVFPLAAWALITIAEDVRARRATVPTRTRRPDLALALALGGGFLMHPLIGLVAFTAAAGALVLYAAELWRRLLPAIAGGAVMAVPQVLTMGAIEAPSWVGAIFIVAGVGVAFAVSFVLGLLADRLERRIRRPVAPEQPDWTVAGPGAASDPAARRSIPGWFFDVERAALVGAAIWFLLALAASKIVPSNDPLHPADPAGEVMIDFPHLVWLALGGAALGLWSNRRGWVLLGCGIAAGLAAWAATGYVGYAGLTEQAVHYEVPKSVEYWLPVMLAIGAAGALAAVCRQRWLRMGRAVAIGAFLVAAIYPITMPLTTDVQIAEHRGAESVGLALREAQDGYWQAYPDSRHIIDAATQEVVDRLRAEEEAGRLGPQTRVLNIANSFQQWASVPVGVFTGALETSISSSPELSIHTEGGRLLGFDQLDQQLASGYGYVLLEPNGLPTDVAAQTRSKIAAAGYRQIWSNSVATIYTKP